MIISTGLKKKMNNKLVKNLIKNNYLKSPTKDDLRKSNEWVNKKETNINRKLFQKHLNSASAMVKVLYNTKDRKKTIKSSNCD